MGRNGAVRNRPQPERDAADASDGEVVVAPPRGSVLDGALGDGADVVGLVVDADPDPPPAFGCAFGVVPLTVGGFVVVVVVVGDAEVDGAVVPRTCCACWSKPSIAWMSVWKVPRSLAFSAASALL